MELRVAYNVDLDIANLLRGLNSVNCPRPSRMEALYIDYANSEVNRATARAFIKTYIRQTDLDIPAAIRTTVTDWLRVSALFITRVETLFDCVYPLQGVDAYLTIDNRCTYSITNNRFFISVSQSGNKNASIMHELFHFYTWHALRKHCAQILLMDRYNDLKESLTVLLNVLFWDLLDGRLDKGYPQHAALRRTIVELWFEHQDLYAVLRDSRLVRTLNTI